MKLFYTLIFIFCLHLSSEGQESSQYTLYMLQKYALNPAYAGLESSLSITGGVRTQWQELPGAPASKIIQAHLPLYALKGGGGIKLEQESFGAEKTTRALVSYNYVYQSNIGLFSGALGVGFIQKSFDGSLLKTPQGKYEGGLIFHQDDILFNTTLNGLVPQLVAGLYFAQDQLEVGISFENFHSPVIDFNHGNTTYQIRPRTNLYVEYNLEYSENLTLAPSILIKSDFQKVQTDISALATINQKLYAGIGFRGYSSNTIDALSFMAGLRINENLKILYGFDVTLSSLNVAQQGSHELMLNYNLNKKIGAIEKEPIIYNPRY
ncbi:MAG: PorP/SprF family type IX secretion system membrane protein [Saprospiraceae bacterium]